MLNKNTLIIYAYILIWVENLLKHVYKFVVKLIFDKFEFLLLIENTKWKLLFSFFPEIDESRY